MASEVKNARCRRSRLTKRARLLSTEDLLTVVALREGDRVARSVLPAPGVLADAAAGEVPGATADAEVAVLHADRALSQEPDVATSPEAEPIADAERG